MAEVDQSIYKTGLETCTAPAAPDAVTGWLDLNLMHLVHSSCFSRRRRGVLADHSIQNYAGTQHQLAVQRDLVAVLHSSVLEALAC